MLSAVDYSLGDTIPAPDQPIEVAPGILWLRLPMPLALDHINLYLLDDGAGWALIDCGLSDPVSRGIWESLLGTRLAGREITRIIVTHYHPDHIGLAGWLTRRTGAELWMSQIEWLSARSACLDTHGDVFRQICGFLHNCGLERQHLTPYRRIGNDYRRLVSPIPATYKRIARSTRLQIGGRDWVPIFGAGHSPDHVMLYCEADRILLGGDFLLPRITPVIAVWWQEPEADPLRAYLEFLGNLDHICDDVLVLPAHDRPYREMRTRIGDLADHHAERLAMVRDLCREPAMVNAVKSGLFTRTLNANEVRFAIGETLAHLNYLMFEGSITRTSDADGRLLYHSTG